MAQNFKEKAISTFENVKFHWTTPAKGYYMPYKEIIGYAGGGIGVQFIVWMALQMILSTTNILIGNTLGVGQTDMYIMYVIVILANIPLTAIRANIIDNTRNKQGKYRPYILQMGIPVCIINILFVWFPYDKFGALFGEGTFFGKDRSYVVMCAVILILNLAQHFFYYFFYDAYENLIHVLSPNSQERANVSSIKAVIYSLAPSIMNIIIPMVAKAVANDNMYDIRVYKYTYPPITIISFFFLLWTYVSTKEKIVQAKSHFIEVKFIDALREVARNKYFWIISLAGWLGFLESAFSQILAYLYNYGGYCNGNQFALIQTIYGNASLWGMLAAPFCIKKWGKKAVLIVTNLMNIIFIAFMIPVLDLSPDGALIWLILSCLWMNALMGSFAHILNPAIQADIRDYQQYVSGERIDGMFSAVGAIGAVITLITSSVLPIINEHYGINMQIATEVVNKLQYSNDLMQNGESIGQAIQTAVAGAGGKITAYFSLYDPTTLHNLLKILIVVSIVGATINVVPYFWYDLSEIKQRAIVAVLKIRALFEDFGNGVLNDKDLVETIEIIDSANEHCNAEKRVVNKDNIKKAKQAKYADNDAKKATVKAAKKQYNDDIEFNKQIDIAKFVMKEIHKFETPHGIKMLEESSIIYTSGVEALKKEDISFLRQKVRETKRLPKNTYEEKEIRKEILRFYRNRITAAKYMKKYFNGKDIAVPDKTKITELFNAEDENEAALESAYKKLYEAQKAKDNSSVSKIKNEIKQLKKTAKEIAEAEKVEIASQTNFNRAAKPYLDAEKLVKQAENYKHYDEIKSRYDAAKARVEEEERLAEEKAKAEREEKIRETAEKKAARKAEKEAKKSNKDNKKNK